MSHTVEEVFKTSRFRVVRHSYSTPTGESIVRESVQHPGAVTIIPLVAADEVCLIRNYRVAVGETLVELPAGTLDPDEDPTATARRVALTVLPRLGLVCQAGLPPTRAHGVIRLGQMGAERGAQLQSGRHEVRPVRGQVQVPNVQSGH